jgi:putative ATPase
MFDMPSRKPRKRPDMFAQAAARRAARQAPLAARMRPRTLDEFVGQEHLVGEGRLLRQAIEADEVPSMVLWGPPGCGKTTLARIVAGLTRSHFEPMSAVAAGVADLRRVVDEARDRLGMYDQRTILFIDEIHRFNKAQQDAVLPYVEDGTVTLIGATTENPSFEVISPLLSRCRVYTLEPLTPEQVELIVRRALADDERGLGPSARPEPVEGRAQRIEISDDTIAALAAAAAGDARIALNALELAAGAVRPSAHPERPAQAGQSKGAPPSVITISLADIEEALQHRAALYDRAGDWHYDIISAFIKSLRGSDPDAALYWLARMLEGGEDPLFVARRLVILASEDVGLADPHAIQVAVAAQQAVHFVGMPEGFYPLAEATIYLATAPKSNSVGSAYLRALQDARATRNEPVPLHLRNPVTPTMRDLGYGRDYKYDHFFPGHHSGQEHLPKKLRGRRYYAPGTQGYEQKIAEWMRRLSQSSSDH